MKKMMQKSCALLLALLFVCGMFAVSAIAADTPSGKAGDGVTWSFDASTATLTIGGSGEMDNYYYDDSGSIPAPWFNYAFDIEQIVIGDGVTRIGDSAFYLCYYVKQIRIPETVTSIGSGAFNGTGLYYDKSNWKDGLFLVDGCVLGTDYFSAQPGGDYTFPDGVRLIADSGIQVKMFNTLTLPASLRYIGSGAFSTCSIQSIVVDANNPYFAADGAILYNKDKTELLAYLEDDRDPYLSGQTQTFVYEVPAQVTRIGSGAFLYCTNFSGVVLPEGLKSIGFAAFQGCEGIASVTFPEGLTDIGSWAFASCPALKTVELPKSLKSVGDRAFYQCKALETATFKSDKTELGAYCFAEDPALKTVELPKHAESIPDYIFQGCPAITTITVPGGVKTIGLGAFSYCTALESVTIPLSVQKIQTGAFYNDTALKTVDYRGTQEQWDALKKNVSDYNEPLLNAAISVIPPLTLDAQTLSLILKEEKTLKASREGVEWSSSDENVVKVDASGKLTTVGKGTATVTATDPETNETVTCKVTVIQPLTLDAQTLSLTYKDEKTLKASREGVKWSSSNEKVVKVDASGKLTTIGKGTATVTATDPETNETVTCEVTVKYSFIQILIRIFLFGWIWY